MSLFKKKKFASLKPERPKDIPPGVFDKCPQCSNILYVPDLKANQFVCKFCDHHFPIGVVQRFSFFLDEDTFEEHDADVTSLDPLKFNAAGRSYARKLEEARNRTNLKEAILTGSARLEGLPIEIAATDSGFIMGSMGSVVGEKIARAVEFAQGERIPLVIISGSGGGASMYEGILSLMQMAKVNASLKYFGDKGLPYISIITNPTMGGVAASFASVGDVVIAEPGARMGFTGPRIVAQITKKEIPEGFQSAEFQMEHGFVDMIVQRKDLRPTVARILRHLWSASDSSSSFSSS